MKQWLQKGIFIIMFVFICGCQRTKQTAKPVVSSELFGAYYEQAEAQLEKMTLEEKIGQLFLIRFSEEGIAKDLETVVPAGYVLFAKDIEDQTKDSLRQKLAAYQQQSSIPLIFTVDEEGGIVTRISRYSSFRDQRFESVRDYYLSGGIPKLVAIEEEKDQLLADLGIQLNLAPVADVSLNPEDFIYNRTLGEKVNIVASYIQAIVEKANHLSFAVTLKHFPGYGGSLDTHRGVSVDSRSSKELREQSLPPFIAGIKAKVPVIMVSHNIVQSYDENRPASLSKAVHKILRELGFEGLIVTDDLDMTAIQDSLKGENEAVVALESGNDLLMTSQYQEDRQALVDAIKTGRITISTLNERVKRILAFKYQYGIIKET